MSSYSRATSVAPLQGRKDGILMEYLLVFVMIMFLTILIRKER